MLQFRGKLKLNSLVLNWLYRKIQEEQRYDLLKRRHRIRLILIAAFLKLVVEVNWCELILALVGITVKLLERMICAIRFLFASIRVDGAVKVLSTNRTQKQLLSLQKLVDEQRRIPFVFSNRMNEKKAKELSVLYREINIG